MAQDAQSLLIDAACYDCGDARELQLMKLALLARIADQVSPVGCSSQSGAGDPTGTPDFIGQLYHDTDADAYWRSTGLTSADWVEISWSGASGIIISATTLDAFLMAAGTVDTILSFPALTGVLDGNFNITNCGSLTTINCPLLTQIAGALQCYFNTALISVDLDSLVSVGGNMSFQGCSALVALSLPVWLPTDNTNINFVACALNTSSVDGILARCVANPAFVSGTVDLSGGTNSPPTSVAPGSDYDILTVRGVTVSVNP